MKRASSLMLMLVLLCSLLPLSASAESYLRLPSGLKAVRDRAFYGDRSLSNVVLPDGLKEIGEAAFANSSVSEINLPETLTYIADDAFDNCAGLHAKVAENSYALVWCQSHGEILYTVTEEAATRFGDLTGDVRSAANRETPVGQATVTLLSGDSEYISVRTNREGHYSIPDLPEGNYAVRIEASGFVAFTGYSAIHAGEITYAETFLMVEGDESQTGIAEGRVTDAFTGRALPGLSLKFMQGWNNESAGEIAGQASTDANGDYSISLPIGNYTMTAVLEGYAASSLNIVVQADQTTSGQDLSVAPAADPNEYRIKLTWSENPRDLDSHMTGRTPSGSDFHVYYGNKNAYGDAALLCNLDVDDTSSYGPEVVTLHASDATPYYYYIHHFAGTGTIATSGARIEVYKGGNLVRTFNAPTNLGSGIYWNVFAIENGQIIARNTMTASPQTGYREEGYVEPDAGKSSLTWADGSTVREEIEIPSEGLKTGLASITDRAWRAAAPSWVTLSAASGTGDEDGSSVHVDAAIAENKEFQRQGDIVISARGCLPLVVHIIQAGSGAELTVRSEFDAMNGDGEVPGRLYVSIADGDDANALTAENVTLDFTLSDGLRSEALNGRKKLDALTEGEPWELDFEMYFSPTRKQLEQLANNEVARVANPTLTVDITTENCGSYQYVLTLDAVPDTIEPAAFEVYMARQILEYSGLSHDIAGSGYSDSPYRAMIEPLMSDEFFQETLNAWLIVNFNVSNVLEHGEKQLNYYRAYVYALLCAGEDGLGGSGFGDSIADANGLLKSINKFITTYSDIGKTLPRISLMDGYDAKKHLELLKEYSDFLIAEGDKGTLPAELQKRLPAAKAFKMVENAEDVLSTATTIGDILTRIMELSKLKEITDEKRDMLNAMAARSDNWALKAAVTEYADLLPSVNAATAAAIIAGEETAKAVLNKAARAMYKAASEAVPELALSQFAGKTIANLMFNTDDILGAYYECMAGMETEDLLIEQLLRAKSSFLTDPRQSNAERFISAVEMFYVNKVRVLTAADAYAKAVLEGDASIDVLEQIRTTDEELKNSLAKACGILDSDNKDTYTPKTVQYAKIHSLIESAKRRCGSFMAHERAADFAGYYAASQLWIGSENLERVK